LSRQDIAAATAIEAYAISSVPKEEGVQMKRAWKWIGRAVVGGGALSWP
jgi:hypothetical protein